MYRPQRWEYFSWPGVFAIKTKKPPRAGPKRGNWRTEILSSRAPHTTSLKSFAGVIRRRPGSFSIWNVAEANGRQKYHPKRSHVLSQRYTQNSRA